ncbi:CBS domain-containing protein [Pseudoalteromonas ruthenica]|uniref:CBS domain-containing protein n=1 Tax=Pseudoalteromonas ruthenica TaxID=151081 RepID=A0A0F4PZV7_9GAMM|nr:CBS domain-containing protein [Pseudoalteromonas ruthenica]KJY97025.1 hypothetical protein TW76_10160 [Pseudoalteromonas ruthenica]KJZ01001.1 hypothetical protein TW72_05685 [Pseudoalteromonas ruthenica]TMO84783.1 CBS domain-containing protein [Pseudoalteromonas ruthenica]TMO92306.1 CBS domain-containing protein [Pseudoalteromonas ruthenica]TMO95967.1 CBS domain-containing protein [Pseudoalteromonas ruthenica]
MFDLKVQHAMSRSFLSLSPDLELTAAIALLKKHQVIGAPVVDEQQQLVGYLSEQDCLAPLTINSYFCDGRITVADVMHQDVLTTSTQTPLLEVALKMQQPHKPKQYPVVEQNKVIGIISRTQVLHALSRSYQKCSAA